MLFHNQGKNEIVWEAAGRKFRFGPYDSCDIPDEFVPHLRAQKVNVDTMPVPSAAKVRALAAEQEVAVRSDEGRKLLARIGALEADLKAANEQVVAAEKRRDEALSDLAAKSKENEQLQADLAKAKADAHEAEEVLGTTLRELETVRQNAASGTPGEAKGDGSAPVASSVGAGTGGTGGSGPPAPSKGGSGKRS